MWVKCNASRSGGKQVNNFCGSFKLTKTSTDKLTNKEMPLSIIGTGVDYAL